jgi:hypothetical protein
MELLALCCYLLIILASAHAPDSLHPGQGQSVYGRSLVAQLRRATGSPWSGFRIDIILLQIIKLVIRYSVKVVFPHP